MQIRLKKAVVADIPILLDIEKSVAGTNIYSPMLEENEWIEEFQKSIIYLVEEDDVVVGNVSYERKSNNHVYISGLVVRPGFQGRGIARKVLTKILEELRDVKRVDLVTHPDNHISLKLYQSLGFAVESRKENYYGDGEPRLVLVKEK